MAKLHFFYGCTGSSKTAIALMTSHNYKQIGKRALLVKTVNDELTPKSGLYKIHSKTGLEEECILFNDLEQMADGYIQDYDAVIVDDIHFATREQIDFLADIADRLKIPVLCYGLRTDIANELFEGSARLLAIADKIEEIKTICWCGHKATCNARYSGKKIIKEGTLVPNAKFVALCRQHYKEGKLRP